ncbi:hypothetical protein CHF27_010715 [Romboutsia maritimum]|uniref:Uncharacterized protein n=1 Tax=Romboutsia maritimum TaxID=2020948 RepID=A0A371IR67_9FIRM|nr:hypothetical protein [Romboutsia maritimum]RDY22969.1 hypothetical protein CHF27_010715 [Romboutsia maritimum]
MKRIDSATRATNFLIMFCIVYSMFEMNILLLTPILTIVLPYKFMKSKDFTKFRENRKLLNSIFIFNMLSFIAAIYITNNMNTLVFDLVINISISFVYFKILSTFDKKTEDLYKNPQVIYDKINKQIKMLEMMYTQTEEGIKNAQNEKDKSSLQAKLEVIGSKINQSKQQLEIIKKQVELNNKINE